MNEKYFVLTGRPNAGKSSIIKAIIGMDVVTGKRAGTTRQISKYLLNDGLVLVDMPGFGRMLGASRRLENRVNDDIIRFLESNSQKIVLAIHVLDISTFLDVTQRLERKGFMSVDVEIIKFLEKTLNEFPLIAANKIDKTTNNQLQVNSEAFMNQISDGNPQAVSEHVFLVSAKTKEGIGALKNAIHERLVERGYKTPFKTR